MGKPGKPSKREISKIKKKLKKKHAKPTSKPNKIRISKKKTKKQRDKSSAKPAGKFKSDKQREKEATLNVKGEDQPSSCSSVYPDQKGRVNTPQLII